MWGNDGLLTIGTEVPSLRSNVGIDETMFAMIPSFPKEYYRMMKGVVRGYLGRGTLGEEGLSTLDP